MTEHIFLASVLTGLQVLDGWTTYHGLKRPGVYERMRFTAWLIEKLGKYLGLIVAKGWAIACGWAIVLVPADPDLRFVMLIALTAGMAAVVWHNWTIYRSAR